MPTPQLSQPGRDSQPHGPVFPRARSKRFLQQRNGRSITEVVVGEGYAREDNFLEALAKVLNMPFMPLGSAAIETSVLERLPTKAIFQYNVIPSSMENGSLLVATNDPFNAGLVDALRLASGLRVRLVLSPSADIAKPSRSSTASAPIPWPR